MKRSKFSLSHRRIFTGDMGEMIPVCVKEVLPGDSWQHSSSALVRVSPLLAPVLHPVHVKIDHWFIPDRLTWVDSEIFHTGGEAGTSAPTFPTMAFTGGAQAAEGSLADYLGVPTGVDATVSALPFRAYQLIWNEHLRNTLLQTAVTVSTASGADTTTDRTLKKKNWQRDYFTSCSPEPQLGPEVTIPIGTEADVLLDASPAAAMQFRRSDNEALIANDTITTNASGELKNAAGTTGVIDPNGRLYADLSAATGISIRQLRESTALQRFMEAQMMHGSRYSELLAQWGVRYSDARLQRPEYLGGGRQVLQFSEVLQTGVTTDADIDGVGNLRGHGIGTAKSNRYRKTFEEHGFVISTMTVLPETMYIQGVDRMFNRRTKTDYYVPQFAHVGQQEVLNKEVYAAAASPDGVFGYQDRYDEYRRATSSVHGQFRSTLDFWHYGRKFSSEPALNAAFVNADPTKRTNQVTSEDVLWVFVSNSIQARRIVSASATPGGSL